ncbi:DUF1775 domain-containing protein [Pseudonocardia sp. DSM 110487]|uniref:DUF1775 domain-containing protein n=1 Tax=Pseudonocardia sp. DSM 110487 TaxID=2865833 RepID=UPI001C69740D|nr:DUF1775 domain-containing protein [Pseudonocardia sp. DSM 110487]QYN34423.1 DUF1775 domain-containing protein [Pseudonocardia sp. DSM 110487]
MRSVVAALLLSLVALLPGAGSAAAAAGAPDGTELVIEPDRVEPGARNVTLVFRLTDGDPAPVTGFQLLLPTGRPLVGVTAQAPPGWAADLTTTVLPAPAPSANGPVTEIASAVSWTATEPRAAGAVDFTLHVDLMPEGAGPVRFRAVSTDAAGNTAEWTDSWAEGGPKPAHDALKLALGAAPRPVAVAVEHGDHHGEAIAAPPTAATPAGVAATAAAVLAAAAALIVLLRALSRRQRRHLGR